MKNALSILIILLLSLKTYAQELNYNVFVTQPTSIAGELEHGIASFGPTFIPNTVGDLVWAYTQTDSLACDSVVTDLTNKVAFIRRGTCNFSLKVLNAQKAGAIGVLVVNNIVNDGTMTMGQGSFGDSVNIPSAFISYEKGEELDSLLMAGEQVEIRFTTPSIKDIQPHYSKRTPLLLARPWNEIRYKGKNTSSISVTTTIYYELVAPSNSILGSGNISVTYDSNSYSTRVLTLFNPINLTEIGEYTVNLSSGLEPSDTFSESFEITDGVYSYSSVDTFQRTAAASDAFFANPNILGGSHTLYIGSEVKTSTDTNIIGTRFSSDSVMVSFGIANESELVGRHFDIEIYEKETFGYYTDPDLLNSIASAQYTITAEDTSDNTDFIQVKMESSQFTSYNADENRIIFEHGTDYLVMVKYQGSDTFPTQPLFFHTLENVLPQNNTLLFYNTLYTEGWALETMQAQIKIEFEGCLDHNVYDYNPYLCENELLTINDSMYAPLSNVFQVIQGDGTNSCDSVLIGSISELETSDTTFLTETICANEPYTIGSASFNTTGTHSHTLDNAVGCDSVVVIDLTVNPISETSLTEAICPGESFTVGSTTFSTTGIHSETLTNMYGCDSIITLDLTVNPISNTELTENLCVGESFMVGSSNYSATGNYTDTLSNVYGCDSIIELDLTVNPPSNTDLIEAICSGESFMVGMSNYTSAGNYSDTLMSIYGCDSVVNLDLTVNPLSAIQLTETICDGEMFTVGATNYTTTGEYSDTLMNIYGCDSVIDLNLTVNPVSNTSLTESICEGNGFMVGSSNYTTTGNYSDVLVNIHGCDSIVELDLTVNPVYNTELNESICQGESYLVGTSDYSMTGIYSDTLSSIYGCDSIVNLDLTVNLPSSNSLTETICDGEGYLVGTMNYSVSGSYSDTLTNMFGCDSIVNLDLTVNSTSNTQLTETICEGIGFSVGTSNYFVSGNYSDTLMNVYGCDSVVNLDLTVNPTSTTPLIENICQGESYMVGTSNYTNSGTYSDTLVNMYGCDSVVNLDLTVNLTSGITVLETICDGESYTVGTSNYTLTGNYSDTLMNMYGCDSIVDLDLTVNPVSNTQLMDTICEGDGYTVGSSNYIISGLYSDTLMNMYGCDSIVDLDLTVNPSSITQLSDTICEGDSYMVGTSNYTMTGNYSDTLINSNGCDSIVELDLTVPVIDILVTVNGTTLDADQNNAQYQWLTCPDFTPIPGEENQSLTVSQNGLYAVEITYMNCKDTSECIDIKGIGISELENYYYSVHPNPFIDKIEVKFNHDNIKGDYKLTNTLGQIMIQGNIESNDLIISTETLPIGSYYLVMNINGSIKTLKMVK